MKPTLHIAAACDESYAMPLAVMLASLSENVPVSCSARVHILQRQLPVTLRQKIEQSVNPGAVGIKWIDVGAHQLTSLRATLRSFDTVSLEAYYRLLLPSVLPGDLDKVLYLDSDLVVIRDVMPLWDLDVTSTSLFAVPELALASSLVSSPAGILLYRELGLPPNLKFFNSGVMLINLRKWRDERVALRALLYLEAAKDYLRWHDQEALNAILAGDWRELDPCWNVTMHLFRPDAGSAQSRHVLRKPRIVHFNSAIKPWQPDFSLGFRDLFFHYLDKTAWSGWRPDHQSPLLRRLTKKFRRAAQKRYHNASSRARILNAKVAGWRAVHGHIARIDANPIPAKAHHELRAIVNVIEPGLSLAQLLIRYDELGVDRTFLLVSKDRLAETRILTRMRINLHVLVKGSEDRHLAHLLLRSLLSRFGRNHWCALLNSNELLYYPNAETFSLKQFCRRLDLDKFDAMTGQVVELTPLPSTASPNDTAPATRFLQLGDSLQRLGFQQESFGINSIARDPVTQRIFPTRLLLDAQQDKYEGELVYRSKVALLKFHAGMSIAEDFRAVHGGRLADVQGAVLRVAGGISEVRPWAACRGVKELLGMG